MHENTTLHAIGSNYKINKITIRVLILNNVIRPTLSNLYRKSKIARKTSVNNFDDLCLFYGIECRT